MGQFGEKLKALSGLVTDWPQVKWYLARRHLDRADEYRVTINNIEVVFDTRDFYSKLWFHRSFEKRVHEPGVTSILAEHIHKARGFVDIGANLGYFTVVSAKMRPDIPVYSFEMDHLLKPIIERNLAANQISNATVVGGAIAENDDPIFFTPHCVSFLVQRANVSFDPFEPMVEAHRVNPDEYFKDIDSKPNFIKMDIDGAEMGALRCMGSLLDQPDLHMFIEVHPFLLPEFGSSCKEVLTYMLDRGLTVSRIEDFRGGVSKTVPIDADYQFPQVAGEMLWVTRQ